MKFKYACSDAAFPLLPHKDFFRLVPMLGCTGADIGLFEERSLLQPSMIFPAPEKNGAALRETARQNGLSIADVFYQAAVDFTVRAINHPDSAIRREEREAFQKILDYAAAARSYHVTCLPGVHFLQESYGDSFARAAEELAWRAEQAQERGLAFGVEGHIGSIAEDPDSLEALALAVPGMGLTLDYTHFIRQGMPNEAVHKLIAYANHFHARAAAPGKLQTILAENTIDYPAIAKEMERTGYEGWFGLEYTWNEWEGCNRTDNVSETILLRRLMKELEV